MKNKLKNYIALSLIPQVLIVRYLHSKPGWIEEYYSLGIYPYISSALRTLYGWVPFSVGDFLYTAIGLLAIGYLIRNRHEIRYNLTGLTRDVFLVLSIAYFSFHLLWGLNYHRVPLAERLELKDMVTKEEVIAYTRELIAHTNQQQLTLSGDSLQRVHIPYTKNEIRQLTLQGYQDLAKEMDFAHYTPASIKTSLYSRMLSYMGYGGYLNPFTNEGQVNRLLPAFRAAIVYGHEIGHQLGYSAENETNFIGYLVTLHNNDPYLTYAANAYALGYCLAQLRRTDPDLSRTLYQDLNPGVQKNYEEMDEFWRSYENPTEPVFKAIFNSYLHANKQKDGILSYNRVVSLIIAYQRKEVH
ncbi:DUF3810 domain-containing protein [Zeaxanthinibacter sp. PT1]|uniref:DUF3810 domain-containing protein n=1 Tax=Zeaxanthinibacter TaxID=561554 RepID=UPI00234BD51F|nr:DUF3810 domain-containing protein [Zeaxanthinibacter sp. PT1]MDC6352158.1 DUF3810 domain-containing protein [Zeaxanthinibacter sp. PT1]